MPPQLKGQKTHKTMWITPGALNMHWIHVTVKCISSPHLAIVAHERNIFAVSRQLVIISLDLILCWIKENCCESVSSSRCSRQPQTTLRAFVWNWNWNLLWFMLFKDTDARWITYEGRFAQELGGGSRSHIVDRNWALGLVQILMVCGGKWEKCM